MKNFRVLLLIVLVAGIVFFLSHDAEAQCSMCRASLVSANDSRLIRSLNLGVLVLLIPPVTIFCSLFIMLRRYRNTN